MQPASFDVPSLFDDGCFTGIGGDGEESVFASGTLDGIGCGVVNSAFEVDGVAAFGFAADVVDRVEGLRRQGIVSGHQCNGERRQEYQTFHKGSIARRRVSIVDWE